MTMTSHFKINRRHFLAGTAAIGALSFAGVSFAASRTLNVLRHRVHQTSLGDGHADALKDWKPANDAAVNWTTFDSNPLMDRLFREASLSSTDFSVGFMVDNRPTSEIAKLFEPLGPWLEKDPIEEFDDIAPGLVQGMTVD